MTEYELYHSPFSIKRHKSMPYRVSLEVIIAPDGSIEYANPSHQEYLIRKVMEKNNWTRDETMEACPKEYYCSFMEWLSPMSGGYVPVWENWVLDVKLTPEQVKALHMLKSAGLFLGIIPGESNRKQ